MKTEITKVHESRDYNDVTVTFRHMRLIAELNVGLLSSKMHTAKLYCNLGGQFILIDDDGKGIQTYHNSDTAQLDGDYPGALAAIREHDKIIRNRTPFFDRSFCVLDHEPEGQE